MKMSFSTSRAGYPEGRHQTGHAKAPTVASLWSDKQSGSNQIKLFEIVKKEWFKRRGSAVPAGLDGDWVVVPALKGVLPKSNMLSVWFEAIAGEDV